jgi:hypothetical protein
MENGNSMKKQRNQNPKACYTCTFTGQCKWEVHFKTQKINSCPDYREKGK